MAERSRPGTRPPPESAGPFASSWRRRQLTVDERVARGLAARQEAPRSSHGRWEPAPGRPDPVTLLEQQAASRVPDLVPIRHGRMLASPFTFYRGAALIMAADLAASFEIMGRYRGFSPADRRAVVMAGVREYRSRMRRAAGMGSLDAWYEHFEVGMLLKMVRREVRVRRVGKSEARAIAEMAAKARTRDSAHARWGDRIAISSYLGKGEAFDRAIADFSAAYADQNEQDYAAFAAAVDSGRLAARTGV